MVFPKGKKDEEKRAGPPVDTTPITGQQQRDLMEERLIADPRQMSEMSDEEIVEIAKHYRASSPIRIPNELLDPNYVYRWVGKTMANWRNRRGVGWVPITENGEMRIEQFLRKGVRVDQLHMGTHIDASGALSLNNDLILCCMLKKVAEVIRAELANRARAQRKAARSTFHNAGKLAGVETLDTA